MMKWLLLVGLAASGCGGNYNLGGKADLNVNVNGAVTVIVAKVPTLPVSGSDVKW